MRLRPVVTAFVALSMITSCSDGEGTGDGTSPDSSLLSVTTSTLQSTTTSTTPPATTAPTTTTSSPSTTTTTTTTTTTVPPDVTPPELVVTDPVPGATVATRAYTFRGTTEPGSTVSAWDRWEADVDAAGNWSITLVLNLGSNVTRFMAVDAAGNNTVAESSVTYVPPPMPCQVDAETGQEYCGGWGDIIKVDLGRSEIIFDLYRYVSTGPEEYEFEYVNENPLLRTLRVADDVEIQACTPEPSSALPSPSCGTPHGDAHWTLADLADFVAADAIWWNVTTQNSIVTHIHQWWWP